MHRFAGEESWIPWPDRCTIAGAHQTYAIPGLQVFSRLCVFPSAPCRSGALAPELARLAPYFKTAKQLRPPDQERSAESIRIAPMAPIARLLIIYQDCVSSAAPCVSQPCGGVFHRVPSKAQYCTCSFFSMMSPLSLKPRMKKYNHIWPAFAVCIFVPREQG